MFPKLFRQHKRHKRFFPVSSNENEVLQHEVFDHENSKTPSSTISLTLLGLAVALISSSAGFFAGSQSHHEPFHSGLLVPSGTVKSPLTWNATFSRMPQERHYMEWKALFPAGWGFVEHPVIAPELSTLGVWHQLHCLQVVYHGYYNAASELNISNSSPVKRSKLSHHAEGCFDYLRQSILCHADTNIEPLVPELYGEHTAIPRLCKDINGVIEWSERWKAPDASEEIYSVPDGIIDLEKELYT